MLPYQEVEYLQGLINANVYLEAEPWMCPSWVVLSRKSIDTEKELVTDFRNTFPFSLREIERSICQTIEKYEPRLKSARVKFIPQEEDRLSLTFKILGRLFIGDESVVFESELGSDGKIKVKR